MLQIERKNVIYLKTFPAYNVKDISVKLNSKGLHLPQILGITFFL